MLPGIGRPIVQRMLPAAGRNAVARRNYWRRNSLVPWSAPSSFASPRSVFADIERQVADIERAMWDSSPAFGWRPFVEEHPTTTELFRLANPIMEVDGVKQFKLEFDVRRFSPENVKITADSKDSTLSVEAKHEDESSRYEMSRKISIPEGVDLSKITCKHRSDGVLVLQAPYEEPKVEPPKETELKIEHK